MKINLIVLSPFNHISRFDVRSDDRQAWLALRQFYEGEDFIETTRESAFARPTSTFYKGETSKFNFEKYINAQKTAHKISEDCNFNNGSSLDDATKIQHFKSGIWPEASLEVALTTSRISRRTEEFRLRRPAVVLNPHRVQTNLMNPALWMINGYRKSLTQNENFVPTRSHNVRPSSAKFTR